MKVGVVLGEFPRLSERFIARELAWLAAHECELCILPLSPGDAALFSEQPFASLRPAVHPLPHWLSVSGVAAKALHPLRALRMTRALRHLPASLAADPRRTLAFLPRLNWGPVIAREALRHGCDLLWAHWATVPGLATAAASLMTGLPFVLSCHAWDVFVNRAWRAAQTRTAKAVTCCSRAAAAQLETECASANTPLSVVHHGVSIPAELPEPRDPAAEGRASVLAIGRFVAKKGFADLIAAAAHGDFRLEIMGDGPLRGKLESRARASGAAERIRFEPLGDQAAMDDAFARCNAFCAPSVVAPDGDRDGIPNVLLEATLAGLPVVGTTAGGLPEFLEDAKTGLVCPPGNPLALAAAFARLDSEPGLGPRLVSAARSRVREEFDVEKTGPRLRALLAGSMA